MNIYNNVDELIGRTPLVELKKIKAYLGLKANIYAKLEMLNPSGSIKDRASKYMLDDAENRGLISSGATIIEPTSGNTGIGLAMLGAVRGYKVVLTMPENMSEERIKALKIFGAEVVLTDAKKGMAGAIDKAKEINKKTPNSFIPSQFDNPANCLAHYMTTGPEIWKDIDGKIDVLVSGVGSGGTISGTGRFLKEKNNKVIIVAVEPSSSPMIEKGISGAHKIQGIGANFIPENFDRSICDLVVECSDKDAFEHARLLSKMEGISAGISSGAALFGAIKIAEKNEYRDKNIVIILPDTASRYFSTELFNV